MDPVDVCVALCVKVDDRDGLRVREALGVTVPEPDTETVWLIVATCETVAVGVIEEVTQRSETEPPAPAVAAAPPGAPIAYAVDRAAALDHEEPPPLGRFV